MPPANLEKPGVAGGYLTLLPGRRPRRGPAPPMRRPMMEGTVVKNKRVRKGAGIPDPTEASPQYARSLIEASLDPFVTISPEGKITDVNEATIKVTGVPRDELIGTDFSDYFTEPDEARRGYERVFAKSYVTDYPLTIRHRDGRLTSVLLSLIHISEPRDGLLSIRRQRQMCIRDRPDEARRGYERVFAKSYVTDYPLTIRHRDGRLTSVLLSLIHISEPTRRTPI